MLGDDPPYLSVGTEVSAKYKGAFCEAKIRKVVRSVKCRVTYKQGLGTATVTDDQIKGVLRVGASVEAKHNDKKDYIEATITKIQDCSQYTVVFDDGDITTLRRTALCLKSGRHFAESETLDQLPLTHPEHFGNPVIGGRRGRRSRAAQDDSSDDEGSPPRGMHDSASGGSGKEGMETEPEIGRVVCVELGDKKKKDNWFPGLVVAPTAQDTVRIRVRDDYLVRSFKDARYYTVPKKEATEFTKELVNKVENSALKVAVEKALLFLEKNELPPHWDRDLLFGNGASSGNSDSDGELDSDSSDDEPREEKDHFVAQLYKFMDDRGTPINNCPMIGNEDIDLYRLFRAVYKMGGYNRVTNQNQWKSVTRRLSFSMQSNSSTYNLVKQAYKKFLHSFEDFYRKLGCTMVNHPRGSIRKQRPGRSLIRDKDRNTPVPLAVSKPEKEEDEREVKEEPKEKKKPEEEKKDKSAKKEPAKEEEAPKSSKRKPPPQPQPDDEDESASEKESDEVNVEAEEESSSSDKSQKRSNSVMKNRAKYKKEKDESKKKTTEKRACKTDTKSNQDKKEEKVKEKEAKEEDSAKTRSKSKEDAGAKKVDKTDSGDGSGSSKDSEKSDKAEKSEKKVSKQKRITDEELKKRGRKRKDVSDGDKKSTDDKEYNTPSYKGPVEIGDRLQVYYGPNHESKVTYEAKVVDVDHSSDPSGVLYLVHYTGWNTRYDEWIKASRIAQNFTQTQGRVKRTKSTPRPQTPSSTKSSSDKSSREKNLGSTPGAERGRRRAQSVAPFSEKKDDSKKDSEKDTDKSARSSTPTSSCVNRTKSPAVMNQRALRGGRSDRNAESLCPIELRRRVRKVSGQTDASLVVSDSEESNSYESDTTEPEQTPKPKSKAPTEERSRREARKRAESRIKVEADNSDAEQEKETEEPRRGRRLRRTLGKIQPEIKSEPDSDEDQPKGRDFDLNQIRSELKGFDKAVKMDVIRVEDDSKGAEKEPEAPVLVPATVSPKPEKKPDVKVEPTEPKVEDSTEDIYEFKEPEPFEFEVRNKRDFSSEKEKIKKRPFEEETKMSPKKKPKVVSPKEVKQEESPGVEYKKRSRQKAGKIKVEEVAVSPSRQPPVAATPCEEAFDKMCENNSKKEPAEKISANLNLLFNTIEEETKERVPVSEVGRASPFSNQKESPKEDKVEKNEKQKEKEKEEVKPPVLDVKDQKSQKTSVVPSASSSTSSVPVAEAKFEYISPMLTPSVAATIPIAARLPATSTIEEKLALAVAYVSRERESKEVEEQPKKASKKTEAASSEVRKGAKKYAKEKEVREEPKKIEEVVSKENVEVKEEVKKESAGSKLAEVKKGDKWSKTDQLSNWECVDKGKSLLNQEFADSTDSSDSERRLVIDNEDFQEEKTPFEKPFVPKVEEVEKDKKVSNLTAKSSRTEEDRENMSSLLCEEEIPGSPTSELEEKEEPSTGTRTSPKTGAQESALASLMEMPFASAPTSSEQSKCESSTTMSISLAPSCSIGPARMAPIVQPQHEPQPAPVVESNEAAPVMDNTPPTTPDSSISNISESPREERTGGSSPMSEDNSSKPNRDSSEGEEKRPRENQDGGDSTMAPLSGSKTPAKRSYEESPSPKKRKRNRKHSETGAGSKKAIRQSGRNGRQGPASDSDDTNEGTSLFAGAVSSFGTTGTTSTVISTVTSSVNTATAATPTNSADHGSYSSRSPRPMKYNFYVELDPELDGSQRIAVLQQKLSELRKTYNSVKVELAGIERRRKKLKRREREAMKAAKAEMQQACS